MTAGTIRPRPPLSLLSALGAALLLLGGCSSEGSRVSTVEPQRPVADSIPGLGRSAEAVLRDDTVAYWEAWKRARSTATCMRRAGFTWHLDVGYPQPAINQVAASLNVRRDVPEATRAEQLNAQYYDRLDPEGRDSYSRALHGESAVDMEELNRTGAVPAGRDELFASGGCLGSAWTQVGSIWNLRRQVGPEILKLELEIKQSQFGRVRADYGACAKKLGLDNVDGPEAVDELLTRATEVARPIPDAELRSLVALTDRVSTECNAIWAAGSNEAFAHAVSVVRGRSPDVFDAQVARYGNADVEISRDQEFLAHLAKAAGRSG